MPSAFVGAPTLRTYIRFGVLYFNPILLFSILFYIYLNSIAHNFYKFNQNLTEWFIYDIISVANSYKKRINRAKFGG